MADRAELLRSFAERLERLRIAAGMPSYLQIARLSPPRQPLKKSTIGDVLRGRSRPSLDFLIAYVEACRHFGESTGVGDDELFHMDSWRESWFALQRQLGDLRRSTSSDEADNRRQSGGAWPTPRQLPPGPAPFVGRQSHITALDGLLGSGQIDEMTNASAVAIDGAAGVGKTALTLHWAHHVRTKFPDGDLYLNLRGYDGALSPVAPDRALGMLLRALDMPVQTDSLSIDERSSLWRSVLAERRMLVVLDNAVSAEQVRPMLPSACGSMVVITSRRRLGGLAVRDGVPMISLAPLSMVESRLLLQTCVGADAVASEPEAADQLAELCGNSPLALRIVAERATTEGRSLAKIADELGTRPGLDALTTMDEDPSSAVRTVLTWSYRALPESAALVFRLFAAHPGPHVSDDAIAAIADVAVDDARRDLRLLHELNLVQVIAAGRYEMHDLVRLLATETLHKRHDEDSRSGAARREVEWYLHTAAAADRVLMPGRRNLVPEPPSVPVRPLEFTDYDEALAWCDAERDNVLGIVGQAAGHAWLEITWKIPTILLSYFNLRKAWVEWIANFDLALAAARELGDRFAEATSLNALGIAHRETGRFDDALDLFARAAATFRELAILEGESYALNNIGIVYQGRDDGKAIEHLRRALAVARAGGSRAAEATALHNLGESYLNIERFEDARGCVIQTLAILEDVGDRPGIGFSLTSLGEIYARLERWGEAVRHLRAAVVLRHEVGDVQGEAIALLRLAAALDARGDHDAAVRYFLCRARAIFESLGDAKAAEARALQRRL